MTDLPPADLAKLAKILSGTSAVVSDAWLDLVTAQRPDDAAKLVTAINRKRRGLLDANVCWSCDWPRPADLTYRDLKAYASADAA